MKAFTRVLLVALFATSAYADTTKSDPTKTADTAKQEQLTKDELQVMAHYHAVNQMEIDLGTYAIKNGGTRAVKSYGEMLVKEHGDNDTQLKDLAKNLRQTIPAEKPATEAEKQEKAQAKKEAMALKKLKGAEFDRLFLQTMIDQHDRELAKIDTKMADVQSAQLADLLRQTKPMLQHHADAAREIQKSNAQASAGPTTQSPIAKAPQAK